MNRIIIMVLTFVFFTGCEIRTLPGRVAHDTTPTNLLGITWQWESTKTPVETIYSYKPENYTIRLNGNGRFKARFDCNSGGGRYQLSEDQLTFGPMMSTRMACAPDSLAGLFMRELGKVVSFYIANGHLYLDLKMDDGTMCFRPAP